MNAIHFPNHTIFFDGDSIIMTGKTEVLYEVAEVRSTPINDIADAMLAQGMTLEEFAKYALAFIERYK